MDETSRAPGWCGWLLALAVVGWLLAGWGWVTRDGAGTEGVRRLPERREDAASVGEFAGVDAVLERMAADPAMAGAALGWVLLDREGEVLHANGLARTALCPASALKVLTTGAALERLGPEKRFVTRVEAEGAVGGGGRVGGDLILVGSGDPTLSSADLKGLARRVAAAGVRSVAGRVRVDGGIFPEDPVSEHWNWGDVGNAYGAGAWGVNVDHNRMRVRFRPSREVGDLAAFLGAEPEVSGLEWRSRVRTGAAGSGDGVVAFSEPGGGRITLRGTVPAGVEEFAVRVANPRPMGHARELFERALREAGVVIAGERSGSGGVRVELARHDSVPVERIAASLHRSSDNLEAQCLYLALGAMRSWGAAEALRRHWEERGVRFAGLRLLDGSGLARANRIRPVDLAEVMRLACQGERGGRFRASLVASADGVLRSKNGAMSGVRTEVGELRLEGGGELYFAFQAEGLSPGAPVREWLGKLLAAVREARAFRGGR